MLGYKFVEKDDDYRVLGLGLRVILLSDAHCGGLGFSQKVSKPQMLDLFMYRACFRTLEEGF